MASRYTPITDRLHHYLLDHGVRQDDVLRRLAEETGELGSEAVMQVAPEEGAFLEFLVRTSGAKQAIELGTFTGYSAISIARGLGSDGRLLCCDVSEEWTEIARRYFEEAGVEDRIEIRIAPALETIDSLPDAEVFDFAFIDADKTNYTLYYERLLTRTKPGGLIAIDNVFWGGGVAAETRSQSAAVIHALNERIARDERVDLAMIPIADGLTIVRKR